jgi:hypothetical protein
MASPIERWIATLTPEEFEEHQRAAGRRRWARSSIFDRMRVASRLRPYRLSKEAALERLARANEIKAERQFHHSLSKPPELF